MNQSEASPKCQKNRKIRLDNLRKLGFPTKSSNRKYEWYSWLRFKEFAQKSGTKEEALQDHSPTEFFWQTLSDVNRYYQRHPECAELEGLEKFKGPRSVEESYNDTLQYYYGKGWYKWYRKTEFEKQMEIMFKGDTPIRKLELFGHDPWTNKISPKQYEQLLKMTHNAIAKNEKQNKIAEKLIPYSGPQCNEDRGKQNLLHYNPDFRFKRIIPDITVPNNTEKPKR